MSWPRTSNPPHPAIRRRSFLKGVLAAGTISIVKPTGLFAAEGPARRSVGPGGKVNLACVGIGNRGADVVRGLHKTGLANIVAFCDTELGGKRTLGVMDEFPDVPGFQDFRKMFDRLGGSIDAVSIATPDHSHFPIAMLAMSLGKHVYVEKPMAHTFRQIGLMMAAEKKYAVACQMGNQGHSEANYFQFKAWTEAGLIRNVTRIDAFMNNPRRWHGMNVSGYLPAEPVPGSLDWESWLATAREHSYNSRYLNGEWRSWFDFGNGTLGDWGAHIFDTAHEFLNLGLPTEVDPVLMEGHSPFLFPQACTLAFKFPARGSQPPVELTWYEGQRNLPPLPGDDGGFVADARTSPAPAASNGNGTRTQAPGKFIYGEGLTFQGGTHGAALDVVPVSKAKDLKLPEVPASPSNHFKNFLLACTGAEQCRSSFAVAGPLCQTMALGVIAQQVNARIKFDPATQRIVNHPLANDLLVGPPPRREWEQFYRL